MGLGSKIENLKVMSGAGLPVPKFETFSFDELVPDKSKIRHTLAWSVSKSTAEKSALLKSAVRESVCAVRDLKLDGEFFSVRSSSGVEDSADNRDRKSVV